MSKLPPYADFLGITADEAGVLTMPHDGNLGRPAFLHGGAISGLLEMAAIMALWTELDADGGGRIKPVNVTVDFTRGGRERDTFARGRVTRLGRRVANVEAIAWQDDPHRPIATARMTYLVVREPIAG